VQSAGFVSGRSTHADRVATIREIDARYGVVVDPHTADGLKVGREHRDPAVPLVCLETALPVKFGATIREALGRDPARPAAFDGIEQRPQRFVVLPADASKVKAIIEESAAA
jgi:threonine synthase